MASLLRHKHENFFLTIPPTQAEKGLKAQVVTATAQLTQAKDSLNARDKEAQQLQAQLKTAQGSFDQELKKRETQVANLQAAQAKKACFKLALLSRRGASEHVSPPKEVLPQGKEGVDFTHVYRHVLTRLLHKAPLANTFLWRNTSPSAYVKPCVQPQNILAYCMVTATVRPLSFAKIHCLTHM